MTAYQNNTKPLASVNLLSVVVPVTLMHGRLEKLKSWIALSCEYPIKIILVHDYKDEETRKELLGIVQSQNSKKIVFN